MSIQDNAETNISWTQTEQLATTMCFRRACSGLTKLINSASRFKIVNTVILPFLLFRLAATPLSETRLYQIQKLQRRLYLGIAGLKQRADELKSDWQRRRSTEISQAMERHGLWHAAVARAHVKFSAHIIRSKSREEWAGTLDAWEDANVHRRRSLGLRLGRLWPGHVASKWRNDVAEKHAYDKRACEAKDRTF